MLKVDAFGECDCWEAWSVDMLSTQLEVDAASSEVVAASSWTEDTTETEPLSECASLCTLGDVVEVDGSGDGSCSVGADAVACFALTIS